MKVKINKEADIIIASSGEYPKDINLYQGTKASENALWRQYITYITIEIRI